MPESITATVQADEEQAIQADEADPAPPGDRLSILANVEGLRAAWQAVARLAKTRTPKPVLASVKLVADGIAGSTLEATNLEAWAKVDVVGVKVDRPGSILLPVEEVGAILRSATDEELVIEEQEAGDTISIRGSRSKFVVSVLPADEFPVMPPWPAGPTIRLAAADLGALVHRTIFATDPAATRYALGGALAECGPGWLAMVATEGHVLARCQVAAEVGDPAKAVPPNRVVPKALQGLLGGLGGDDGDEVEVCLADGRVAFLRAPGATLATRLVEGRFPRWQDIIPTGGLRSFGVEAGALRAAVEAAGIMTGEESRGIDFRLGRDLAGGLLSLAASKAERGRSEVEVSVEYDGDGWPGGGSPAFTLSYPLLIEGLRAIDGEAALRVSFGAGSGAGSGTPVDKTPVVFRSGAGGEWTFVVMPLSADQKG